MFCMFCIFHKMADVKVDGPRREKVDGPKMSVDGPNRLNVDGPKRESERY